MKNLLLLHGALGSKDQLQPLMERLSGAWKIHAFNFAGHGGEPLPEQFSIEYFAKQTIDYCEEKKPGESFNLWVTAWAGMSLCTWHFISHN